MKGKRKLLLILLLSTGGGAAQAALHLNHLFQDIKNPELKSKGNPVITATHYRLVKLNMPALRQQLKNIFPFDSDTVFIDLPFPDGSTHQFRLSENHTMAPELAAKYPDIKTYNGYGLEQPNDYLKLDVTPQGLHAMILRPGKSEVFIDPAFKGDTDYYMVYNRRDFNSVKSMKCGVTTKPFMSSFNYYNNYAPAGDFSTCFLRQYRLAVAATSEYTAFQGGQSNALAAQVTTINRVNGVYETDIGVTLTIIPNNDQIVFTSPYPTGVIPYSSGNATLMIDENQSNIDFVIGSGGYDVGHVFDRNSSAAGLAGLGVVCDISSKAQGVTGSINPVGDPFDIDYVAHELGHQFNANHTQNNDCNRNDPTAVEPGSGSTIMGYAGICAPNVQNNSNAYFNGINLAEIGNFVSATGNVCASRTPIGPAPVVAPLSNIVIPASTPFMLNATATGLNSHQFSYAWEQQDAQITVQPPTSSAVDGPNFRSVSPTLQPTRFFPGLAALANNGPFTWEVLPGVSRTMNFRVSVRANTPGGSCNAYQDLTVNVDASAGPFRLNYPNAPHIKWYTGTKETIKWAPARTNLPPVNADRVNILLSTNGGLTYPVVLASNVLNNGSYTITVPALDTDSARIMVRASNQTFFNISSNKFSISTSLPVIPPSYTYAVRNPLNKTSAFVYYNTPGTVTANDQLVVNGLEQATALLDLQHQRFIINSIRTPRNIPNVSISIVRNGVKATSNSFTIPGIL